MNWILAGLAFGLLGSVHCVGMCGPPALSLPGAHQMRGQFLVERLLYNLGRVLTYTLLGGLAGLVGRVASTAWRARLQRSAPAGLAAVGLLLIVRGLALGGMVSPLLPG
ncbi:MAG: hypothetical protein BRD55_10125 [Bacteroidetes bacterium SW_9_63_38]|nr:MAG: hypothetical protein BRD55_10125 [Bacteroidetes bacterium SW_9_63_38]